MVLCQVKRQALFRKQFTPSEIVLVFFLVNYFLSSPFFPTKLFDYGHYEPIVCNRHSRQIIFKGTLNRSIKRNGNDHHGA
jgi:hypothetical protein